MKQMQKNMYLLNSTETITCICVMRHCINFFFQIFIISFFFVKFLKKWLAVCS